MFPLPSEKLLVYFKPALTSGKNRLFSFLLAFIVGFAITVLLVEIVTDEIPVFGFHDIVDINNPKEIPPQRQEFAPDYTKQDLEEFLDYLVQHNYWFLSSQELYDYFLSNPKKPIPPEHQKQKKVTIVFDDGYKSVHTNLLPILEKLERKYDKKVKVTLFINAGFLGHRGTVLDHASCEELRDGFKKGFYDLQSHGLYHNKLTLLKGKDLDRELAEDQRRLRKCTQDLDPNKTVASHIAYPFGAVNKLVDKYASKYYLSGYLYDSSIEKLGGFRNNYRISRLTVNKKKSVKQLIKLADGGWL